MNNENSIENLLIQVAAITKKYESIAEITGENFNVFKVLGLSTNEVQTHSAFLTELLNPGGSHGCKDVFLNIFIDQMRKKFYDDQKTFDDQKFLKRLQNFKPENAKAFTENHIGFINESGEEGGRIDILVKGNDNSALIIENKIHANDQDKQLIRYNNAYRDAPIFYLTLTGSAPSNNSKGELKEGVEYVRISYKEDIINWLEQCLKEAVNHPILRETIRQYINLIKLLTNQTINDKMSEEIAKTIAKNEDFIKALFELQKSNIMADVRKELLNKFQEQISKVSEELNLELIWDQKIVSGVGGVDCKLLLNNLSTNYYICFGFEANNYFGLMYGIYPNDKDDPKVRVWITQKLDHNNHAHDENWPDHLWLSYLTPKLWEWDKHLEPWLAIFNGSMIDNFKEEIKKLVVVIKEIENIK